MLLNFYDACMHDCTRGLSTRYPTLNSVVNIGSIGMSDRVD